MLASLLNINIVNITAGIWKIKLNTVSIFPLALIDKNKYSIDKAIEHIDKYINFPSPVIDRYVPNRLNKEIDNKTIGIYIIAM